jgi:carbon-monoxide dehydrogenase medium subunit
VLDDDGRTVKNLKLVMGSVSPRPLVSAEVPGILVGREFSAELVEKAAEAASGEARPISDIRGSAEYRREMVAVLARRLLQEAFDAAREV